MQDQVSALLIERAGQTGGRVRGEVGEEVRLSSSLGGNVRIVANGAHAFVGNCGVCLPAKAREATRYGFFLREKSLYVPGGPATVTVAS